MKHENTAKRLRLALQNNGITAQELCDLSGVSKASISQYVNGSHKPSNISAQKMGMCLGVSPLWLMGFDVPMDYEQGIKTIYHSFENKDGHIISIKNESLDVFSNSQEPDAYYLNEETREIAQEIFENKELRMLFDVSRKASAEHLIAYYNLIKAMQDAEKGID